MPPIKLLPRQCHGTFRTSVWPIELHLENGLSGRQLWWLIFVINFFNVFTRWHCSKAALPLYDFCELFTSAFSCALFCICFCSVFFIEILWYAAFRFFVRQSACEERENVMRC